MLQDGGRAHQAKAETEAPAQSSRLGGISRHGATKICIFDGIMDADLFCNVLETTLVPFIRNKLPDHRFMQDNCTVGR